MTRRERFVTLILTLALTGATGVGAVTIAVGNPGFEHEGPAGMPAQWALGPADGVARGDARSDTAVRRSGAASVALVNQRAASTTVVSEPVSLRVGHVYRLSAFIRTEAALSDPAARYPTAVPACLSMASFPFTNHSAAVGRDSDWTRVEAVFIATATSDRVRLHLGANGTATGAAWFDDVALEEVTDVAAVVPPETVRWAGRGYRYDDRGWIFLHLEGPPYLRGFQHGTLLADEIATYIGKLANGENPKDPVAGWNALRHLTDALMLRGFDEEFLTEMRGTAEGAARAGARFDGRTLDLLDIATVNSVVDLGQLKGALKVTPTALSGRSFLAAEEELALADRVHKCSAVAATGPATADGRVVFGQLFMWSGYTGVHFNVHCDLVPESGRRLVFQTFPGGIHSGTDFYINSAGMVIGETTVAQTPFDASGTPQSNRIRKAAQYATSIDEAVAMLRERNNGLYTNDWPMADIKTNEVAVYLLGTHTDRLWRSSEDPAPFGTPGFMWCNNNARDDLVRREYAVQADDAPADLAFSPWNRDIAFQRFYQRAKGRIDVRAVIEMFATSPINRPHACDGKVTSAEMAEQLVFLAHYGKVTLREKFPAKDSRRMPDLPGAIPHLTLGYSTASPVVLGGMLAAQRRDPPPPPTEPALDVTAVTERATVDPRRLWRGSLIPASEADTWLTSAGAAYWQMLHALPETADRAFPALRDQLAELDNRLLYTLSREGDMPAVAATRRYDRTREYQLPRLRGTFLLHQLRLSLGNDAFLALMADVHARWAGRPISTAEFTAAASAAAGRDLAPLVRQWTEREGLPDPRPAATVARHGRGWRVRLEVAQPAPAWHLFGTVAIEDGATRVLRPFEVTGENSVVELDVSFRPTRVVFDAGRDFPVRTDRFYTWANWADEFDRTLIVYGTAREIEANRTLALRFQATLADAFSEILPPVVKDCELDGADAADHDLIVLGQRRDNAFLDRLADRLPVEMGANFFRWRGRTYGAPDDGLLLVVPNPANPARTLYLFLANSALELHAMTKSYPAGLPSWAVFKGEEVKEKGPHPVARFTLELPAEGRPRA